MKKWMTKWVKRSISLGLSAIMAVTLMACSDGETVEEAGTQSADSSLSRQYVYSCAELDLDDELQNGNLQSLVYRNDRVYALIYQYSWSSGEAAYVDVEYETDPSDEVAEENTQEVTNQFKLKCVSMKVDGSDKQTVMLSIPEEISAEDGWLVGAAVTEDGYVYGLQDVYGTDYSDPDNPLWYENYYLLCWNPEGEVQWYQSMSTEENDWFYVSFMEADEEGNLLMLAMGEELRTYDREGNLTESKPLDLSGIENWGQIIYKGDNQLLITKWNNEYTKQSICVYDMGTGTVKETVDLPDTLTNYSFSAGTTTDFILTMNGGLYTYNLGDEEPKQVMDFINSDLAATYLNYVTILDDTHILACYNDIADWSTKVGYFTYVNPEDIPERETLVLGGYYVSTDVKSRVIDFNKASDKYRITIKDYSVYSTMDDYMAGYTQLNNDIISGQMPDILIVDSSMDLNNYVNKGLLADIGALIDSDPEMAREDFLQNVLDAYSIDGKLYTTVSNFYVQSVIGKESLLGDRDGWNMEEFNAFISEYPEASPFGTDLLRDSFMWNVMYYSGADLVDQENGQCHFDSEEFKAYLTYANTLPSEYSDDYWEDYYYDEAQWIEDKTLLLNVYIYSVQDLIYTIKGQMGDSVEFVGFPCEDRDGSVLSSNGYMYALSAKSSNLDAAWEFVRYYLTEEYQESQYGLPVLKSVFDKKAQEATQKPSWTDGNGEKQESEYTYWINDEIIELEPFTQEEIEEITAFLTGVNKLSYYKSEIQDIISEEAEAFFSGQKSVDEVTEIIQSRVQIYVNETR